MNTNQFPPGDEVDVEVETPTPDYSSMSFEAGDSTWVVVEASDDCIVWNEANNDN